MVINVGVGEAKQDYKLMDAAVSELRVITGQQPIIKRAKKSVAGFKVREGMPVGCCVTLRGARMWEFLDRMISLALPRIKDFRGVSPKPLMAEGIITLGSRNSLYFQRLIMIR